MLQAFLGLGHLAGLVLSNTTATIVATRLLMLARDGYRNLSPANKAKVDAIMTQAAEYFLNGAVADVAGWSNSQAVAVGLSPDAANVVEIAVKRIGEVGLSKAREEMRG